jgi:hypothetical protein
MQTPNFTPDPREAKLPVWAQELLQSYRATITDLSKTVTAFQGLHQGTNVVLKGKSNQPDLPLPNYSAVAFRSNWGSVQVNHDLKGLVRIQGDNRLIVRLEAGNALTVELED